VGKRLESLLTFFQHLHDLFELFIRSNAYFLSRPFYFRDSLEQMHIVGVRSLPIVLLISGFTGMVLALQSGHEMATYGAKMYVGSLITISLIRELGPVLVAMVVTGRVGAGIAAELGSMTVTEQIDAMRSLGTNPIRKLVTTRLLSISVMLPILTIIGDAIGIMGGMLIGVTSLNISRDFYWSTVLSSISFDDMTIGIIKPFVFAAIISTIGCYMGLTASGGTKGVGEATTRSVVISMILIFIADFLITKFMIAIS
jgi:phospholipid/cholesterol/gamma-HCH transport system permease protein